MTLRRAEMLRGRGLVRYRLGRCDDALADFAAARELATRDGDRVMLADLMLDEAMALDWRNDFGEAAERVAAAERIARELDDARICVRVLVGVGRSQWRANRWPEARALLERAVTMAEPLGEAGYESWVIAQLLLGWMLPELGEVDTAAHVLDRVERACAERGDSMHRLAALGNRYNVRLARRDGDGLLADLLEHQRLSRELGLAASEYLSELNLGETRYQLGQYVEAAAHAERARLIEQRQNGDAAVPRALLLVTKMQAHHGDLAAARRNLLELACARTGWMPFEQVQIEMLELTTRNATAGEWEQLLERCDPRSMGLERLEVLEARSAAAARCGALDAARYWLDEALDLAKRVPNLIEQRLRTARADLAIPAAA